jgi:hypothetical protein
MKILLDGVESELREEHSKLLPPLIIKVNKKARQLI